LPHTGYRAPPALRTVRGGRRRECKGGECFCLGRLFEGSAAFEGGVREIAGTPRAYSRQPGTQVDPDHIYGSALESACNVTPEGMGVAALPKASPEAESETVERVS
jgi:hypothetical protein